MLISRDRQAIGFALAAVLLWSTVATAFKLTLRHLDVPQMLLLSWLAATLCLFGVLAWRGLAMAPWRQARAAYLGALGLGLLNPFLYYLVLFKAYALLPAQVAQALNYTWAIMLTLLSVPLLGHRVRVRDGWAAFICYAGVVVICLGGAGLSAAAFDTLGIVLALGSTFIWALYWIFKARDPVDAVVSLFLSFLFSLPFSFLAWLLLSGSTTFSTAGILGAVYIGLFEMGVTFVFWLMALRLTSSAARVSLLIYLAPFLSLGIIQVFLGETVLPATVAGLVLIVGGLLLQHGGQTAGARVA